MITDIRLTKVHASEMETLKQYVIALYKHDEDYDSMVNIEEGLKSLFRNEALVSPFFIKKGEERIGYVLLTKYHSVEKGGLTLFIDELYVENSFRRQGVGKAILERIFDIAKQMDVKTLWAQAEPYNDAAEKLFLSNGFHTNTNKNFERPV